MTMDEMTRAAREAVERVIAAGVRHGAVELPEPNLDPAAAPAALRASAAHYDALTDRLDLFRHVCRVPSPAGELFLLVVGFESTDGWLEVFGPGGELFGAAQYVGGRVGWATVEEVRASVETGRHVPALDAALTWFDRPDGGSVSACDRFVVAPAGGAWRLTMNGQFIQDWDTPANARAHAEALALPPE